MQTKSISIIIPVYNVEKYIERCVRSLFEQTFENIEFIFVDDCSPDQSVEILRRLVNEYKGLSVKIISHEQNRGLPSARNTGLAAASGEYVFHCDSDDWLEKDAMEQLFHAAKTNQADIIWCDWFLSFRDNERYMQQKETETPVDCIKAMLAGHMKYNVWNKMVKRSIYIDNRITFPDGFGMGEDMTMMQLFAFAKKVCYVPKALYHYVQLNMSAFTKTTSETHLSQIKYNANRTIEFIQNRYGAELDKELQFFKLNIKLPFLITNKKDSYRRWLEWYPEANSYINQNKMFSLRIRLLQLAAVKRQFWIVWMYYYLIVRVIYGVVYK